ncbi:hypothetical protein EMCRGX_G020517 [Ephydatia muelleri]
MKTCTGKFRMNFGSTEAAGGESPGQKIESRGQPARIKESGKRSAVQVYEAMLDHIQEAQDGLKRNDEGYEKATQEMEAAEALLRNRQKMIKLVDRSELGWSVVEEYKAD